MGHASYTLTGGVMGNINMRIGYVMPGMAVYGDECK